MKPLTPQAGLIRRYQLPGQSYNSMGQLLRGVVVATYVTDDPDHPEAADGDNDQRIPTAVYCDVLCYTNIPGLRYVALKQVLVAQGHGGLHDGRIWLPKAATVDITGDSLDVDGPTEVGNMDGDHVLIGFLEGNPNEPIILGGVPHPSRDVGNEENPTGRRLRLKLEDGNPNLVKHHGTFHGVETNGDWICDTTFANDGTLLDTDEERTHEQPQPTDGKGAQRYRLPPAAEQLIEWVDHTTDPENPAAVSSQTNTTVLRETKLDHTGEVKTEWIDYSDQGDLKTMASASNTTTLRERKIQHTGTVIDELLDYADPSAPELKAHAKLTAALREIILKDAGSIWQLILEDGANTLKAIKKDGTAELQVGDGAKHVAIVEALQTLWGQMKNTLEIWGGASGHTHPTGVGPSGPPTPVLTVDAWASAINSSKVSIPDG